MTGDPSQRAIDLLSLVEAFAEDGVSVRTTVRGTSMAPFIRDGDEVVVVPVGNDPPRVGEVVAFRHPVSRRLTVHRIVRREEMGWVLRGDGCSAPDGVVPTPDVLGRVVRVERRGRSVQLGLGASGAWVAALSRGDWLRRVRVAMGLPRRGASFGLRKLQCLPAYRALGSWLAAGVKIIEDRNDAGVTTWVARAAGERVGFAQLTTRGAEAAPWDGHWLVSLEVRVRTRGIGIGEQLTRRVIDRSAADGATELRLLLFDDDAIALRLCEKLGFERCALPALSPILDSELWPGGRRRIFLRKRLCAAPGGKG